MLGSWILIRPGSTIHNLRSGLWCSNEAANWCTRSSRPAAVGLGCRKITSPEYSSGGYARAFAKSVERNEATCFLTASLHYRCVWLSRQAFIGHGGYVMTGSLEDRACPRVEILVELQPHGFPVTSTGRTRSRVISAA